MKTNLELQSLIGSLERINLKTEIRAGLENLVEELIDFADEYRQDILEIDTDPRLTKVGKKEKMQEVGDELMAQLEAYDTPYSEHIAQAERKLLNGDQQKQKSSTERLLDYMRQSEIRRMYGVEKMDVLEVEAHANDPVFVEAVLTSPKRFLPQEQIDKLVMQKAQKEQPELGIELEQLGFANNAIDGIVKTLKANVENNGWRDPENPLNKELQKPDDEVKNLAQR
jgi:hypothetical protein